MPPEQKPHSCRVCGLHYAEKRWADECTAWCSAHANCNLSVASHSIERQRSFQRGNARE